MFERFTESARQVVRDAQEEARELGHDTIAVEHLLLAIARQPEGPLSGAGVPVEALRGAVTVDRPRGRQAPTGHVPFTKQAKKALELSLRVALKNGDRFIGTAHILESLVSFREGAIERLLLQAGCDIAAVREAAAAAVRSYDTADTRIDVIREVRRGRRRSPREPDLEMLLERLAAVEDARVEEARARAAAEARLDATNREIERLRAELDDLRRREAG